MTKTIKTKTTKTQGAHHDVTTRSKRPSPRPTDSAPRPPSKLAILVRRALDQELEWYFAYAEAASQRDRVHILPTYAALPVLASDPSEVALRARAMDITLEVRRALVALRDKHAEILRAAYTPRTWPKSVTAAFGPCAAVAVRLALAYDPWPARRARRGIEQSAAERLGAAIATKSLPVGRLRAQAERLFDAALVAYAGARGLPADAVTTPKAKEGR